MKKNLKKIGLIAFGIVFFIILLSFGINWWVNAKLPRLISEENKTPYHIKYQELEIGLLAKTIQAKKITIIPKERQKDSLKKNGLFAQVDRILITDFSLFSILFSDKIKARSITVYQPKVTLFKDKDETLHSTKNINSQVVEPFEKLIKVNDIFLQKANFSIINIKNNKQLFNAANVNVQLEGITISQATLKQKIPFNYQKYSIICDSLSYLTADFYRINAHKIRATHHELEINQFSMISEFNRSQFVQRLQKEKDLYTLKAQKIAVKNMDWGFKNEVLFFKTPQITITQADANIYRSKIPEDDLSVKPLYNKLLRELKFELKVDTLKVQNSKLVYEEEKSFDKGAGKLQFHAFNLEALNLNSGFHKAKLPDVKIAIDCKFMKNSPMKVNWSFNPMDKADTFNIKGRILNFQTEQLSVFTKPYLNATTKGNFDQVYFNFSGNDEKAKGDFALKYSDLKIKVYQKKNRDKESKLKTWVGNLLLKNDSDDELIEHEISVKRIKEKSFYNYFWRCLAEGMKKTLI